MIDFCPNRKSSSYLSLSFVIHFLFCSILNLEGSQSPIVVPSALEKSFASLGDGPYRVPTQEEIPKILHACHDALCGGNVSHNINCVKVL